MPWISDECRGCKKCISCCMFKAIKFENGRADIVDDKCILCYGCLRNICPFEAIKKDKENK